MQIEQVDFVKAKHKGKTVMRLHKEDKEDPGDINHPYNTEGILIDVNEQLGKFLVQFQHGREPNHTYTMEWCLPADLVWERKMVRTKKKVIEFEEHFEDSLKEEVDVAAEDLELNETQLSDMSYRDLKTLAQKKLPNMKPGKYTKKQFVSMILGA